MENDSFGLIPQNVLATVDGDVELLSTKVVSSVQLRVNK